jgi:hypothetical protein
MNNDVFRKEAVEKITGPEDLNRYIKVINPRIWLILAGIALAAAGLVIFAAGSGVPVWDLLFGNVGG